MGKQALPGKSLDTKALKNIFGGVSFSRCNANLCDAACTLVGFTSGYCETIYRCVCTL